MRQKNFFEIAGKNLRDDKNWTGCLTKNFF